MENQYNYFENQRYVLDNMKQFNVQQFYSGSCVLITGATGFVGKALIEKLLRSCPELDKIYIIIRPKRGTDVATRHKDLIKSSVFDRIRQECPNVFSKIISFQGDVTDSDLGLMESDRLELISKINIVFHSAATVKFNETLKTAVALNTQGTKRVLELCQNMKNLQAFIHISTAYSNADKSEILEKVYPPPIAPEVVINCCESLPDAALEALTCKLLGKHPNTYTLTKAMAECVVSDYAAIIPTAIVRPSIVTAAWKEPVAGWIDNVSGITGIMAEIATGMVRSIICDQKLIVDVIPVDIVINTLITAAWYTATFRQNTVRVYNCTTGSINPIVWQEFGRLTRHHALISPTKHIIWYPNFSFTTNRFAHKMFEALLHFFPAILIDIILKFKGAKPMMLKIARRFQIAAKTGEFFSLHEFKFQSDNVRTLMEISADMCDGTFNMDYDKLDWDSYVKVYVLGIRKYILKDTTESLPVARKRLKRLYFAHRTIQMLTFLLVLHILGIRKLFASFHLRF